MNPLIRRTTALTHPMTSSISVANLVAGHASLLIWSGARFIELRERHESPRGAFVHPMTKELCSTNALLDLATWTSDLTKKLIRATDPFAASTNRFISRADLFLHLTAISLWSAGELISFATLSIYRVTLSRRLRSRLLSSIIRGGKRCVTHARSTTSRGPRRDAPAASRVLGRSSRIGARSRSSSEGC